ncbi:hypothetical protein [Mycoplana ramosa]|uniref:Uncharacterized protein n=1 Tax=Mycoplana ramosa TaxID=40837 RepID=A0ABW3YWG2_MYCRA
MSDTLPTFRVHFYEDEESLDIVAASSTQAEAEARKRRPGSFVKKIKILRANPELASDLKTKGGAE